jgi:hypothetical protein
MGFIGLTANEALLYPISSPTERYSALTLDFIVHNLQTFCSAAARRLFVHLLPQMKINMVRHPVL